MNRCQCFTPITGPPGATGLRGSSGSPGLQGVTGLQGATGTNGLTGSAMFSSTVGYSVDVPFNATTGNVDFLLNYNSSGSGVTPIGFPITQFTLLPGTYAVDWYVIGVPFDPVPITFGFIDVPNVNLLAESIYTSGIAPIPITDRTAAGSFSFSVPSTMTVALHNLSNTIVARSPYTPITPTNRAIRFMKLE